MRILLTNDDGINAPGLAALEAIACELAGPAGEIWTVAPAFEQSGVGHCISYTHPTMIAQMGPRRWAAEGSPADCVMAALGDIMAEAPPDLVLSGVNRGNNAGENAMYSGTIGGAMEAALQGIPAVALSQYLGPETAVLDDPFEASRAHAVGLLRRLVAAGDWGRADDYMLFYNVNFPPLPADGVRGTRVTPQGRRREAGFGVSPQHSPTGRRFVWVTGGRQDGPATEGSDVAMLLDGFVTVTPMRADLTCRDSVPAMAALLDSDRPADGGADAAQG